MANGPNTQSFPQISAPFVDQKSLITSPWRNFLQSLWNQVNNIQSATAFFSGMVVLYSGPAIPVGWFVCNGAAISRSTYSSLFTAIGVTWGAGNGTTTFNVPNLTDKFIVGAGISPALGTTGGNAEVTLAANNLPIATASNVATGTSPGGAATSGSVTPFSLLPPYSALYYIIKQ